MKSSWKTVKLSEIAMFNPRESIKKGTLAKKIPMDKLVPFCRDIPEYTMEEFKSGTKFRNNDTIMARITPCLENGKIAKVNILEDGEVGFGSTEYIVFRSIEGISDPDFLYYLVCSSIVKEPAIKSMVGSSGRQRVQADVLKNLEISIPPIEEQRKIGKLLKQLDDKIEVNNKINNNLLEQVLQIYNEVTINAPISKLNELIEIIESGKRPKGGAQNNGIPSIGAEKIEKFGVYDFSTEKYVSEEFYLSMKKGIVKSGDVLLYKDGAYTGKSSMALNSFPYKKCVLNEHVFLLRTPNSMYQSFLYCCLNDNSVKVKIEALAKGKAAQPGLNQSELKSIEIKLPNKDILQSFENTVSPLMQTIALNALENKRLNIIRNTILPKLISNKIDFSNINI